MLQKSILLMLIGLVSQSCFDTKFGGNDHAAITKTKLKDPSVSNSDAPSGALAVHNPNAPLLGESGRSGASNGSSGASGGSSGASGRPSGASGVSGNSGNVQPLQFSFTTQASDLNTPSFGSPINNFQLVQPIPQNQIDRTIPLSGFNTYTYNQTSHRVLDILLVLDTSSSMRPYIGNVLRALKNMTQQISGTDWQIKVVPSNNIMRLPSPHNALFTPCTTNIPTDNVRSLFRSTDPDINTPDSNGFNPYQATLNWIANHLPDNDSNLTEGMIYHAAIGLKCQQPFVRPNSNLGIIFVTNSNNCNARNPGGCGDLDKTNTAPNYPHKVALSKLPTDPDGLLTLIGTLHPRTKNIYGIIPYDLDNTRCVENVIKRPTATSMGYDYVNLLNSLYSLHLPDRNIDNMNPEVIGVGDKQHVAPYPSWYEDNKKIAIKYNDARVTALAPYAINICKVSAAYETFFTAVGTNLLETYSSTFQVSQLESNDHTTALPPASPTAPISCEPIDPSQPGCSVQYVPADVNNPSAGGSFSFNEPIPTSDVKIRYQTATPSNEITNLNLLIPQNSNQPNVYFPDEIKNLVVTYTPPAGTPRTVAFAHDESYQTLTVTEPQVTLKGGDKVSITYDYVYAPSIPLEDSIQGSQLLQTIEVKTSNNVIHTLSLGSSANTGDYYFANNSIIFNPASPNFTYVNQKGAQISGSYYSQAPLQDSNGNWILPVENQNDLSTRIFPDSRSLSIQIGTCPHSTIDDVVSFSNFQFTIKCPTATGTFSYRPIVDQTSNLSNQLDSEQLYWLANNYQSNLDCMVGTTHLERSDWNYEATGADVSNSYTFKLYAAAMVRYNWQAAVTVTCTQKPVP